MTGLDSGGRYSELVLASTSPARHALLTGLGLPFRCEAPGVDETVPPGMTPAQAVGILAERKARAVWTRFPHALVIGSDQLVGLEGRALGKAPDAKAARAQLQSMAGRTHEICTAVCVVGPGFLSSEVEVARLTLWPLTETELDGYVATGEWQGCAGSYRVEGRGQALFKEIQGDRTGIQGLPMTLLVRLLREAGVTFF
ncbi:MAG: maf [Myxococcaceae bacterium]|nr:maf [Myxococcaceae bacterium]